MIRPRWTHALATAVLLGGLLAGCGDDGDGGEASAEASAEGSAPESTAGADGTDATDDASTDDAGAGGAEGCPDETTLGVVFKASTGEDEEIVAPDTVFPAAHFTLDLDGSGYGPVLSGVLSTDPADDVEALTHTNPDQPEADHRRVLVLLEGPAEGATEFPLGVYDVTFEGGVVDATEGMGLAQLDVQDGEASRQAANFTELELTHVGDGTICGELRAVGRSDDTSQPPTHVEGAFVADYTEVP